MPIFDKYTEVEVDVDDFLSSCDKDEIKEVIEWLRDEEYLTDNEVIVNDESSKNKTLDEKEWISLCAKLSNIRLQMSIDDENTIKKILINYY
jgi:hypothetical protein